jgi:hypothetical protein
MDIRARLSARAAAAVAAVDAGLPRIMLFWVIGASFLCGLRGAFPMSPAPGLAEKAFALAPYALVVAAPVASLMLALGWFRKAEHFSQPQFRLVRYGRWREIGAAEASALPLYGATGLMASLLIGMLLNVPVRTIEFLAAVPPLAPGGPNWFQALFALMLADLVIFSSLYVIAFAAALRHVPLFPRLLVAIWGLDLLMQLVIARIMGGMAGLPPQVGHALGELLEGNVKKVLISAALWSPYLLLSRRVNLTYRHRVPLRDSLS